MQFDVTFTRNLFQVWHHMHSLSSMCTMPILCQLHPLSCTRHILTLQMMVDAAQPHHVHPNEHSLHSVHQTLMSGIKHCCTLQHPLHLQDLFWERILHGSLPPDSSRCIWTMLQVVSTCPQHWVIVSQLQGIHRTLSKCWLIHQIRPFLIAKSGCLVGLSKINPNNLSFLYPDWICLMDSSSPKLSG